MKRKNGLDSSSLYWSEDGEVNCGEHAPFRGSDTWMSGRWTAVTADDVIAAASGGYAPLRCEVCGRRLGGSE